MAAQAAARRHSGMSERRGKTTTTMSIATRYDDETEKGKTLYLFLDNGLEKEMRTLRAAIKCEIDSWEKLGADKQVYIDTVKKMSFSNKAKRKKEWESCKPFHGMGMYNTHDDYDNATIIHFNLYGFKLPDDIDKYSISQTLGYIKAKMIPTVKKIIKKILDMYPEKKETFIYPKETPEPEHGGRRRRRRKSRKKRRKSRRKSRRKNKSRKRRRRTRRRRR